MLTSPSIKKYSQVDPKEFIDTLSGLSLRATVTHQSATQVIGKIPANSLITSVIVARTQVWNAVTTFELGKAGSTNWLFTTQEANLTGEIPAGEQGTAEIITPEKVVTAETQLTLTINQGSASQGTAFVMVNFVELNP